MLGSKLEPPRVARWSLVFQAKSPRWEVGVTSEKWAAAPWVRTHSSSGLRESQDLYKQHSHNAWDTTGPQSSITVLERKGGSNGGEEGLRIKSSRQRGASNLNVIKKQEPESLPSHPTYPEITCQLLCLHTGLGLCFFIGLEFKCPELPYAQEQAGGVGAGGMHDPLSVGPAYLL